jgi:hypothetical protein
VTADLMLCAVGYCWEEMDESVRSPMLKCTSQVDGCPHSGRKCLRQSCDLRPLIHLRNVACVVHKPHPCLWHETILLNRQRVNIPFHPSSMPIYA